MEELAKHRVEIDQMSSQLENYRTAFSKKSAESLELQQRLREISEQNYELE